MRLNIKRLKWAQSIFNDYESNHIAVTAGLGAGKSHMAYQWHLLRCMYNIKSRNSCVVYPTYSEIKAFGIPRFEEILVDSGLKLGKHFDVYTSQTDPRIELKLFNHAVRYLSGDKPARFRAFEYSHALADECGDMKDDVFKLLSSRIRCRQANLLQVLWIGAPQGITEFAKRFDSDTLEGWIKQHSNDHYKIELVEGVERKLRRLRITTDDNPHLPTDYIPNLMSEFGHNANLVRSYRYGYFCPLYEGTAYENYNPEKHDVSETEASPKRTLCLTLDFNANPLTWISLQQIRFEDGGLRWCAINEAKDGLSQLDDAAIDFALKHPVADFFDTPIEIYGDSSGHARSHKTRHTDYQALKQHLEEIGYQNISIRALKYNPLESVTVEAVNRFFSYDVLRVDERCRKLKRSFMQTCWKENERKLYKPAGEDWTHPSDAFKYFVFVKLADTGSVIKSFNLRYG